MKNTLLLIIILQLFSSCQKSKLENLLLDPNKKWIYIDSSQVKNKAKVSAYIKFSSNGDCKNRYISNDNKVISMHGNEKNNDWKYSNKDSILKIYGHFFKVFKYEEDTINMLHLKENWKYMLVNYQHPVTKS